MNNNEIKLILFGFALGVIGSIISSITIYLINNKLEKSKIKKGLTSELVDLQLWLTWICYQATHLHGQYNVAFLNWWKPYYEKLKSSDSDYFSANYGLSDEIFKMNDAEIEVSLKNDRQDKAKLVIPKFSIPYTTSVLPQIGLFHKDFKKLIFKLKRNLDNINFIRDQAEKFFDLSFTDLTPEDHLGILRNIDVAYSSMAAMTKETIEIIDDILKD